MFPPDTRIGDLSEDAIVEAIAHITRQAGGLAFDTLGIGDDAAALPGGAPGERLISTADAFVEGTHFLWQHGLSAAVSAEAFPHWDRWVGERLATANLSDLAAMGARPAALLLTLAAPATQAVKPVLDLVAGVAGLGSAVGAPLIGGDTVRTTGPTVLSVTALGWLTAGVAPPLRAAARPGMQLYVTGSLGCGSLGPELFLHPPGSPEPHPAWAAESGSAVEVIKNHFTKRAQLAAGATFAHALPGCALTDISDSLAREAGRIARASGCELVIHLDALPIDPAAARALAHLSPMERVAQVVGSGEEWELLLATAAPATEVAALAASLSPSIQVHPIGEVRAGSSPGVIFVSRGNIIELPDRTFRHFT